MNKIFTLPAMMILIAFQAFADVIPVYKTAGKIAGGGNDNADYIDRDAAGNIYIAGRFASTCDMDPGPGVFTLTANGTADIYIAKYNPSGAFVWAFAIGAAGSERANSLDVDAAGNIYMTGVFSTTVDFDPGSGATNLTSAGGNDLFVAKYDSSGSYVWAFNLGGTGSDAGEVVLNDNAGNFYLGGEFGSTSIDMDPGTGTLILNNASSASSQDPFIAKYDTSGNIIWARSFQGQNSDYVKGLAIDASQRIVIGGYYTNNLVVDTAAGISLVTNGNTDCYVVRLTPSGAYDWSAGFGGLQSDFISGLDTDGNNIIIAGYFQGNIDCDPGTDTLFLTTRGNTDIFISSLSPTGSLNWATSIGGPQADNYATLEVKANGEILVTGVFRDSALFFPAGTGPYTKSAGDIDGFIAKYDNTGNLIWHDNIGSSGNDNGRDIALDPVSGDFWICGFYTSASLYVDPNNPATILTNSGQSDGFFARYGECAYPQVTAQPISGGTCPGGNAGFSVTAGGTTLTWQWQEGINGGTIWNNLTDGGVYSGANTPSLTLTGIGTSFNNLFYRCNITEGCGLTTTSGVGILFVGTPDTSVTLSGSTLTATSAQGTYQWLDCNNGYAQLQGATGRTFNPSFNGSYAVAITRNGCTDTSSCYNITTLGLEQLDGRTTVRIFPVPARERLSIVLSEDADYQLSIHDLSGIGVLPDSTPFRKNIDLDISSLAAGMYIIGIRKNGDLVRYYNVVVE